MNSSTTKKSKKEELIDIALNTFLTYGYDKTTIRGILKEANGEIGMFYHYFTSKNEIYIAALSKYNESYIEALNCIVNDKTTSIYDKFKQLLLSQNNSFTEYHSMHTDKINPDIFISLHQNTLLKIVPLIEIIIHQAIEENMVSKTNISDISDISATASYIIFGVSAVLHANNQKNVEQNNAIALNLIYNTLGIKHRREDNEYDN